MKKRKAAPGQLGLFGAKPSKPAPGARPSGHGWQPIPGGKHGGLRKPKAGGGFDYWYPESAANPAIHVTQAATPTTGSASGPQPKTGEPERRYEDVGEKIGGARKDLARLTQADLEKDPGLAYKLVTRNNVVGRWSEADAAADRENGVDPAASYLKREVLNSLSPRPPDDAASRDAYRRGCQMLQESLGRVKTVADMQAMLDEWRDSAEGRGYGDPVPINSDLGRRLQYAFAAGGRGIGAAAGYYALKEEGVLGYRIRADGQIQPVIRRADGGGDVSRMVIAMGRRFAALCNMHVVARRGVTYLHSYHGSVFGGGRTKGRMAAFKAAKAITDWSWASPKKAADTKVKRKRAGRDQEREIIFQRRLGAVERVNLPHLPAGADGERIMAEFGVRAVEYGNWVTEDERQWHTEMAHAALHDLSAVLGIDARNVAVGGRLALAFGARGKGGTGKSGEGAAAAHYEPERRVINLTKMKGNGTLAHEYGHFLDHAVVMAAAPNQGKPEFLSDNGRVQVDRDLRTAMREVLDTIMYEDTGISESEFRERVRRKGVLDQLNYLARESRRSMPEEKHREIRQAWDELNREYEYEGIDASRMAQTAYYKSAQERGAYWAQPIELFARAFESWVEDRLADKGQRSSYLVDGTRYPYEDPGAYLPAADPHRGRINAAMDRFIGVLRARDQFQKSAAAWLDSVIKAGLPVVTV
jgi:Large polyvalent protein-associated domain 1